MNDFFSLVCLLSLLPDKKIVGLQFVHVASEAFGSGFEALPMVNRLHATKACPKRGAGAGRYHASNDVGIGVISRHALTLDFCDDLDGELIRSRTSR